MERKIGEIFEHNGEWYQCMENNHNCLECSIFDSICDSDNKGILFGECSHAGRSDEKSVIFKKLEKIGEPFTVKGKEYQRYITHVHPYILNKLNSIPLDASSVLIEVKQNKEDMEEKKPTYEELLHYYHSTVGLWAIDRSPQEVSLDWICDNAFQLGIDEKDSNSENIGKNLREFDLEAAKAGKPVCTRDGRKARILCYDLKGAEYSIVAAIETHNCLAESISAYDKNGRFDHDKENNNDLMMLPEKKEGWIVIHKEAVYNKETAEKIARETTADVIRIQKIEWEE